MSTPSATPEDTPEPTPTTEGTSPGDIPLEDGVLVRFEAGQGREGDYWLIPVREAADQKQSAPVPEGSVLVPLSAWEKTLDHLGNLHRASRDLAEARERAARAEEREAFAQERRREAETRARLLEEELTRVKDSHDRYVTNPEPTTGGTEPEQPADTRREAPTRLRSLIRRIRSR
jgi:hypothetical protein